MKKTKSRPIMASSISFPPGNRGGELNRYLVSKIRFRTPAREKKGEFTYVSDTKRRRRRRKRGVTEE